MLVYGDHSRRVDPRDILDDLDVRLRDVGAIAPSIGRHAALVSAFIASGELIQGLADAAFKARGEDDSSPEQDAATQLCLTLAAAVVRSWDAGFEGPIEIAADVLSDLRNLKLPATVEVRVAEGYAFYGLYPELYLEAARGLAGGPGLQPIGIRSIGAGLAAMVSATAGAAAPVSVRPIGHPYDRHLKLGDALQARLAVGGEFAIVDEGPGMSGSSFGAVLRELAALGMAPSQIHLWPSHGGEPGPAAGPERRAAYLAADRRVVGFDEVMLHGPEPSHRLAAWVQDLTGPAVEPLEDISAGQWRSRLIAASSDWPAAWPQQERRKFILRTGAGEFLLKFAGLGAVGERKHEIALALASAGFINAPLGLRHGFTVEPWLQGARPMRAAGADRAGIIDALPPYLAWRAEHLEKPQGSGASLDNLRDMTCANVAEGVGPDAAKALSSWRGRLERLQAQVRPVAIDGRLHAWEWLRTIDGRLLKTDAVDHHLAHDLVGCQDIAWDLAGAAVEFRLDANEAAALQAEVGRRLSRRWDADFLQFMRLAYAAFQMGRNSMAQRTSSAGEGLRLAREMERYTAVLATELSA